MVGLWHLGLPEPTSKSRELRRVEDTAVDKFGVAAGGKVKRTVLAEYANLQEHVKRVGGFEQAERVYAAPLDADGVLLPKGMKVHNVEWVADGAAKFIQDKGSPSSRPFFLYVGWTLPHGPDADRSLKEATMAFTPAGNWKMRAPLSSSTRATRKEVRKSTAEAYGAAGRHPGILSIEQLYDLATDPNEEKELIQAYSLIASSLVQQTPLTGHREIAAAEALGSFRRAMQRDLADVAVTCGV